MLGAVLSGNLIIILSVPTKGSEIVKIVEDMQPQPDTVHFAKAKDPQYPDRILLGQASDDVARNFLITNLDSSMDGILPDTEYERLVVRSYDWRNSSTSAAADRGGIALQYLWDYGRQLDTMIEHSLQQVAS